MSKIVARQTELDDLNLFLSIAGLYFVCDYYLRLSSIINHDPNVSNNFIKLMSIRPVLKIGDPFLNHVSAPVSEFDTPELHALINDMRDTMDSLNGAGLAAPQIGVSARVVIFEMQSNPRYPDEEPIDETVLINPVINVLSNDQQGMWEGCLSVPGMRGYVERPSHIRYQGFDQFGNQIDRTVSGFHAIVVQHECDHLDGVLYPMRINDLCLFGFEDELENRNDYPVK